MSFKRCHSAPYSNELNTGKKMVILALQMAIFLYQFGMTLLFNLNIALSTSCSIAYVKHMESIQFSNCHKPHGILQQYHVNIYRYTCVYM